MAPKDERITNSSGFSRLSSTSYQTLVLRALILAADVESTFTGRYNDDADPKFPSSLASLVCMALSRPHERHSPILPTEWNRGIIPNGRNDK